MMELITAPVVDVQVTETAWVPQGDMPFEQWVSAGHELQRLFRSIQWLVGDWLLYGEGHYSGRYDQAIDVTGLDVTTLMNVTRVSRCIPPPRRRAQLSWSHHEAVASLPACEQDEWLQAAEAEHMTVARLRSSMQKRTVAAAPQMAIHTHCARVTFKLVAGSDDLAQAQVDALVALLERRGVVVTQTTVKELG